ncbi:MAG: phenylacetate--CoA ligase family protein [Chitinophagaceae bacterium]|nr:phenylacetate--CoA ligase family protein [Chitinophagaceae bacterium]
MSLVSIIKDFNYTYRGIRLYRSMLKNSCYWSKDKMEQYQFHKLKNLLLASFKGIPYYNELFNSIEFDPSRDFKSLSDLTRLPILSKDFVKKNKEIFINKTYLKNALNFKTSGSTGEPFEILVHPDQWVVEQGVVWRHWKWGGYNFRDPLAMVRSFVPPNQDTLWETNKITNFTYFSPFHLNDVNMAKYLEVMIRKKIVILRGYPSSILCLAKYIERTSHPIPKIKLILTASEVLTEQDRSIIEKAFRSKVFNHYGLAEQIVMMGDCERHEGLHNYDEYGYLELLDTDNPKVKRIIGTNLHNLTTPLIRYDTGDLAILADYPCSCGRTLPTIKNVIGRKDLCIKTTEGYEIPTTNFYTMLEHFQEIDRWQIIQHSLTNIEFVFSVKNITEQRMLNLEQEIKKRLHSNMSIILSPHGSFMQKNEGKFNPFISLL